MRLGKIVGDRQRIRDAVLVFVTGPLSHTFAQCTCIGLLSFRESKLNFFLLYPNTSTVNTALCPGRACSYEGKRVAETMMYSYQGQAHMSVRVRHCSCVLSESTGHTFHVIRWRESSTHLDRG
jgi:hypothetical protein